MRDNSKKDGLIIKVLYGARTTQQTSGEVLGIGMFDAREQEKERRKGEKIQDGSR